MSAPSFSAMEENGASEEVEALKSIYIRELEVTNCENTTVPSSISISLHPATADNTSEQYVCLTLVINLPPNYPNDLPEIIIRNPRGLSDEDLERIKSDLHSKASDSKGNAMLFELIELAKEHLTTGNTPRCACAICLYNFSEDDVFTKTDCYHYFHSHCLSRYVEFMKTEQVTVHPLAQNVSHEAKVLCPVCREPIAFDDLEKIEAPPPVLSENVLSFKPDSELVQVQQRMAALYMKQKSQGGIIDVEAEKNKYLLEISTVPSDMTNVTVTRNSRTHSQVGGRKKKVMKKPRDPIVGSMQQDDSQSSTRQLKVPSAKQEGRENRRGYMNDGTEGCPLPEKGNGVVRGRRQQNRIGRGASHNRMDQREGQVPISPKAPNSESNKTEVETSPSYEQINSPDSDSKTLETKRPDSQSDSDAKNHYTQRQNARRGSSKGANTSARMSGGYRGGRGGWRPNHRTLGAERESDLAEERLAGPSVAKVAEPVGETEKPLSRSGQTRRPYGHQSEKWRSDDNVSHARTRQDSYRQRTNFRFHRGGTGRWTDGHRGPGSEDHGCEEEASVEGDRPCPNAEDLPVSHLMVLTGPPTKAFSNSVSSASGNAESNLPSIKQVHEFSSLDSMQSMATKDPAQFCASLPPGFKPKSQHLVPPPPGFETIA